MQGGQGQDWGYHVPMDELDERYDRVKVLKSPRKSQITRKGGQREGSAKVGDQCLLDLGQWSQFLASIEGDPPGYRPDLQTQKVVLPEKIKFQEKRATWKVVLGFEDRCFSYLRQ